MTLLLLQLVLIAIAFAFWNGYIILWGVHKNIPDFNIKRKRWSKIWHMLGWIVRFQIAVLIAYSIWFIYGLDYILILKWELLYIGVSSILYDLIINIVRFVTVGAPPIFYIDNKGINKILLQVFGGVVQYWIARLIYVIGAIIFLFIDTPLAI